MTYLILGCGYTGEAVAKACINEGQDIIGTTTTPERLVESNYLTLWESNDVKGLQKILTNAQYALISVAPTTQGQNYEEVYLKTAKTVSNVLKTSDSLKHLVVISSTSVYGEYKGNWVTEESELLGNSILIQTEMIYQRLPIPVTIIRPGEIIGPMRMPEKKIGAILYGDPNSYTNLTHRDDLVQLTLMSWKKGMSGIYNCCNDVHLLRKEYYEKLAQQQGIDISKSSWKSSSRSGNKRVSSIKAKEHGFTFNYPYHPLTAQDCDLAMS